MEKDTYATLLKHPLWQKRRLEIMQRDNFTCQLCGRGINDGTPLNVHHKKYIYGKLPWEYEDSSLVTLCENCHKKKHGKTRKNNDGIVFYKALLKERDFSIREKIIISYILSHKNIESINKTEVAKKLNISRSTVVRFVNKINKFEELEKYTVNGFFLLRFMDGLSGQILVFFSWLHDIAGKEKIIYANRQKLAKMYNVELKDIRWYLHKLKTLGYIERQSDGKLLLK